jgi:hypothetical protein
MNCGIDAAAQVMVIDQLLAKSGAEDVWNEQDRCLQARGTVGIGDGEALDRLDRSPNQFGWLAQRQHLDDTQVFVQQQHCWKVVVAAAVDAVLSAHRAIVVEEHAHPRHGFADQPRAVCGNHADADDNDAELLQPRSVFLQLSEECRDFTGAARSEQEQQRS